MNRAVSIIVSSLIFTSFSQSALGAHRFGSSQFEGGSVSVIVNTDYSKEILRELRVNLGSSCCSQRKAPRKDLLRVFIDFNDFEHASVVSKEFAKAYPLVVSAYDVFATCGYQNSANERKNGKQNSTTSTMSDARGVAKAILEALQNLPRIVTIESGKENEHVLSYSSLVPLLRLNSIFAEKRGTDLRNGQRSIDYTWQEALQFEGHISRPKDGQITIYRQPRENANETDEREDGSPFEYFQETFILNSGI